MEFTVNDQGYYGKFGGAFIPEMLYPNVEELRLNYLSIIESPEFKKEFDHLLKTDLPFLIREHARKFQWSVAQVTV